MGKQLTVALLLLCVAALLPTVGQCQTYYDGYVIPYGYTYRASDGYWWKDGVAHTRAWVAGPYYSNGYCYNGYWSYAVVKAAYVAPAYVAPTYAKGWRDTLAQAAKDRQAGILKERFNNQNQAYYMESLQALGLTGPALAAPGLGSVYQSHYSALGSYGASGNTVVGYIAPAYQANTVSVYKEAYGPVDVNLLNSGVIRSVQGTQELVRDQFAGLIDVTKLTGEQAARVAEILAKGEAGGKILRAVDAAASVRTSETRTTITPVRPMPPVDVPPPDPSKPALIDPKAAGAAWNKCAVCHAKGNEAKGGNVALGDANGPYANLAAETKLEAIRRMLIQDPPDAKVKEHMPKEGSPQPSDAEGGELLQLFSTRRR